MTVVWGTKTLTYDHKDEKGKRIVASVDVLSISTTLTGPLVENGLYFSYAMLDKQLVWNNWDSFVCGAKWTSNQDFDKSRGGKPIVVGSYYGPVNFAYENHPIEQSLLKDYHLGQDENPWTPDYDVRSGLKSTSGRNGTVDSQTCTVQKIISASDAYIKQLQAESGN